MSGTLTTLLGVLLKVGGAAIVFNEVRGLIMAAPVLWAMYQSGGTLVAIWIGISSLGGIALSVLVPLFAVKRLQKRLARAGEAAAPAALQPAI